MVDEPDLLEGGRPEGRGATLLPGAGLPPVVWRIGSALLAVAVAVGLWTSYRSNPEQPAPEPAATAAPSVDMQAADRADVELGLSTLAQRYSLIRDVPEAFRVAAGQASAMRNGRTPGNFFLALAYERSLYGTVYIGTSRQDFVNRGPVRWHPKDFRRYADPEHRDITAALDSFLAIDTALHRGGREPDFSRGAFGPARLLGLNKGEATSIADIYAVLDGSGVREGLPN